MRLGVSPDAVEFHVGNMRHKLGLRDRSELVAWRASGGEGRKALGALLPPLTSCSEVVVSGLAVAGALTGVVLALVLAVTPLDGGATPPVALPLAQI